LFLLLAAGDPSAAERLARHRNLGKAFYENPTTQNEAVAEFRKALDLNPKSSRERLNYALALLRAGKTEDGIRELQAVQKQDPTLPHTWFNLGIAYKKAGEHERALEQFERMVKLTPDEPISHYNLGALYKLVGKPDAAIKEFETAAKLDPNLAAPRFQLYNAYRTTGRTEEAKRELAVFQALKKQQEGAAIAEDVEWNAYAEVLDVMEDRPGDASAPGELTFVSQKQAGAATGAAAIDINADGKHDLIVWSDSGLRSNNDVRFPEIKGARSIAPGDFNNDGLIDLCVLTSAGPVLLMNSKTGFTRTSAALPAKPFHQAVWVDYDHDYDLDLLLLGPGSVLLRNAGAAGFEDRTSDFPFVSGEALGGAAFRIIPDTKGFDVVVTYASREATLYRDKLQGKYEAETVSIPGGARALTAADINNDGWIDLLYSTGSELFAARNAAGKFQPAVLAPATEHYAIADLSNRGVLDIITTSGILRNTGNGQFTTRPSPGESCTAFDAADFDADGRIDLVCIDGGTARIARNTSPLKTNWLRVALTGVKSAKLAAGSEVEVKAGSRYQKKIYTGAPLHFGIGAETTADTVRITWPNGLIQNEMKQAAGKPYKYEEAQRLSGSCPMIWSWNGREFEYITDVLGVAPLGASSGDGQYFPVDHDEIIQIGSESLRPKNGEYEIRITEELSEVAYLDHIRLMAVDRRSDVALYTNDKFKSPPFPEFRLFTVARPIYPISARDEAGRDVREKLLRKDRTYPDAFSRELSGVAELHHLSLDFGKEAASSNNALLVLSGWVDWADGSTFLGAAQERRGGLIAPYLQVKDANGRWQTVIEDMGMPAGKPKAIVVDLAGKFLSDSREVRIVTNLCVYWDEIFLSAGESESVPETRTVPLRSAELRFRGFSPNRIHPERKQPEHFTYAEPKPVSLWNPTPGLYTRYGAVDELTAAIDDRMIIMGSGDELVLRFDAAALPLPHPGFKREFLLLVDGWAKDRDANTAFSQSVEPLPFHRMSKYPYGPDERFPDTPEHAAWRAKYNTRPALQLIRPLRAGAHFAARTGGGER
jgi:Flp pilus assembly protein TadD